MSNEVVHGDVPRGSSTPAFVRRVLVWALLVTVVGVVFPLLAGLLLSLMSGAADAIRYAASGGASASATVAWSLPAAMLVLMPALASFVCFGTAGLLFRRTGCPYTQFVGVAAMGLLVTWVVWVFMSWPPAESLLRADILGYSAGALLAVAVGWLVSRSRTDPGHSDD